MTIARIGELIAQPGREEELREFIDTLILPAIERAPGNIACQVYQHHVNKARFMVVETWKRKEDQQSYSLSIPAETTRHMRLLLASGSGSEFFDPL